MTQNSQFPKRETVEFQHQAQNLKYQGRIFAEKQQQQNPCAQITEHQKRMYDFQQEQQYKRQQAQLVAPNKFNGIDLQYSHKFIMYQFLELLHSNTVFPFLFYLTGLIGVFFLLGKVIDYTFFLLDKVL